MLKRVRTITVATNEELERLSYRNRLKLAVRNIDIGQREWPTEIQHSLMVADGLGIRFRHACGARFPIPLVDDVWGSERYVRVFLASEICEHPEKDRLIDLYFRVKYPDIARHFGR